MSLLKKIKGLFVEDNQSLKKAQRNQASASKTDDEAMLFVLSGVAVLILAWVLITITNGADVPETDEHFCPIEPSQISGTTYALMDLSEKLDAEQSKDLEGMLEVAATRLQPYEKIDIRRMQSINRQPIARLTSFCSHNIDDFFLKYGRRVNRDDCEIIVAQDEVNDNWDKSITSKNEREKIKEMCKIEIAQKKKATDAAQIPKRQGENRSYIIGAIERLADGIHDGDGDDTKLQSTPTPTRLIIFSDMLQNAPWFSQYQKTNEQIDATLWDSNRLLEEREKQNSVNNMGVRTKHEFNYILVCYLNNDILTGGKIKQHRKMWKEYFRKSGYVGAKTIYATADYGECTTKTKYMMRQH